MQVFLTGATGIIGSAVLDAMIKGGHRVTALARDPEKAEKLLTKGATPIIGELGMPKTYVEAVKAADAVVHAALEASPRGVAKELQALDTMLGAQAEASRADGKSRVFIYTSGVWVVGRSAKAAEEDTPLDPPPHVEWRPAHEEKVLSAFSASLRTVVVRPGIVYGGGRGIIADLIKDALNGLIRVVGPGKNRWPCIYDHDLAELYVRILESPSAAGVIHATDEADERVMDIAEAIAAHLPQRPDIRNVPMTEARKKLGTIADALALDQKVRSPKARALGWTPTQTGVINSVPRLVEEFRNAQRER
ncbi:MAG TPA: NAD-dependent epimerase/dehydratase family protein [Vicinamibacterales bacterium]|nr:NAD-dependent epimerase/dehydratase family protein [Vicinamibacterales bacterium]